MTFWTADDGTEINFEIHGEGQDQDTLLLLPGLLGSISSQWRDFIEPLTSDYRLVMADLRGHGHSENKDPNLMPERIVQDLIGLLDHLSIKELHVAGYDLGGYVGLMLLLHQPERVRTLLMQATKFYWTEQTVTSMQDQLEPDRMIERAPEYANRLAAEHGANRWRTLVRQAVDLIGYLSENGLSEQTVATAQVPVLVSVGDRDELVTILEAYRLSRIIPEGALIVLPGVRHPFQSMNLVPLLPTMQTFHITNS